MNRYEVRISGNLHPIQVRASKAGVALARAVNRFTDSQFLNTAITIKFVGRVPRVWRVKGYECARYGAGYSKSFRTLSNDLPTRAEAEAQLDKLRSRPELSNLHITSSLAEER